VPDIALDTTPPPAPRDAAPGDSTTPTLDTDAAAPMDAAPDADPPRDAAPTSDTPRDTPSELALDSAPDEGVSPDAGTGPDASAASTLEVRFLGVQGFVLRRGADVVLTAPLFTRASVFDVTFGRVTADETAITAGLVPVPLADLTAVVTGHAHYDHLLDVPSVLRRAPRARLYANRTARHLLAALAPDRPLCDGAAPVAPLARDRVVALDDPADSAVDYRLCPGQRPPGAPLEGRWVTVPDARVRLRPLCSEHPDQVFVFHFDAGSVTTDQCALPPRAGDWLEGMTTAYLIDFLDASGRPTFRVYYQDAPTNGPTGHVSADLLAEKRVDLALLCVGNYDAVRNQPGELVAALRPRFALSGHWEDFFVPASAPPRPIPFLNLDVYTRRAETALPPPSDAPLRVDGRVASVRHAVAIPGTVYQVPRAP
jgi:L-ascorbate metabolism protein UlaG (beta-lactamase superfamily)